MMRPQTPNRTSVFKSPALRKRNTPTPSSSRVINFSGENSHKGMNIHTHQPPQHSPLHSAESARKPITAATAAARQTFTFSVEGEDEADTLIPRKQSNFAEQQTRKQPHHHDITGNNNNNSTAARRAPLDGEEPRLSAAVTQLMAANNDSPRLFCCYATRWVPPQQKAAYIKSIMNAAHGTGTSAAAAAAASLGRKSRSQTCHLLTRGSQIVFAVCQKSIYLLPKERMPLCDIAEVVVHQNCGVSAAGVGSGALLEFRMTATASLMAAAFGGGENKNVNSASATTMVGVDADTVLERRQRAKQQQLLDGGIAPVIFSRFITFGGEYIVSRVASILRIVAPELQLTVHVASWPPPAGSILTGGGSPLDSMFDVPAAAEDGDEMQQHADGPALMSRQRRAGSPSLSPASRKRRAAATVDQREQELALALRQQQQQQQHPPSASRQRQIARLRQQHQGDRGGAGAQSREKATTAPSAAATRWNELSDRHQESAALSRDRLNKWDETVRGALTQQQQQLQQQQQHQNLMSGGSSSIIQNRQRFGLSAPSLYGFEERGSGPRPTHLLNMCAEGVEESLTNMSNEIDHFLDKFSTQHEAGMYLQKL